MLKGIRKNMIFVQLPKEKCFEAAYFVMRAGIRDRSVKQGEMIREANRIIEDMSVDLNKKKEKSPKKDRIAFFLYGLIGGSFSVAVAWLVTIIAT